MVDLFYLHGLTRAGRSEHRELQNEKFLPTAGHDLTTPESQATSVTIRLSDLIYYR